VAQGVPLSTSGGDCLFSVRLFDPNVTFPSGVIAIAVEVICLPGSGPAARSSPGDFEFRPDLVPLVRELPTQSLLDHVLVVGEAQPRLLAERVVAGNDVFDRPRPTVLAVFFLLTRPTLSMNDVVDGLSRPRVVRHLIVQTPRHFDAGTRVENVVVVRDESLECHGAVEWSDLTSPAGTFAEISNTNDFLIVFMDFIVDELSVTDTMTRATKTRKAIIVREPQANKRAVIE